MLPPLILRSHPLLRCALLVLAGSAPLAAGTILQNDSCIVEEHADGSCLISPRTGGAGMLFRPEFTLLEQTGSLSPAGVKWHDPIYNLTGWKLPDGSTVSDVFKAGKLVTLKNPLVASAEGKVVWDFTDDSALVHAELTVPSGHGAPVLHYTVKPKQAAIWSSAYSGAPAASLKDVIELWQPLVWDGRRLPPQSFLIPDEHCSIPGCLVQTAAGTVGVMADPWQFPFAMPNSLKRRFGVTVRNADGQAQPLVFAPFPGAPESKLAAGQAFSFSLVLISEPKALNATFEQVAREVCGFHDQRENTLTTLNKSLDNMIDFALSPAGNFDPAQRAFHYPDAKGTVKNVSALHPLALAEVTDNPELFHKEGVPILEYLMSREKFLFALNDEGMKSSQQPTMKMAGPAVPVSELTALAQMSRGSSPVFLEEAKRLYGTDRALNIDWVSPGKTWQNDLWLYRATGDKHGLDAARQKADQYIADRIDKEPADFSEAKSGTFFEYMIPQWKDLYELYLDTHDPKYLEAAHRGARRYAQLIWFYPAVPDGTITVNTSGFSPRRGSMEPGPIRVPQETVPAWRVSEQGLLCEGNGTVARLGILLANHAPFFLRLAHDTNDPFLRDIARSAVIGRYANFPGYHINTVYSTAQEKPDFPLHPFEDLKPTTSFHYNHSVPMANLLLDYLMAEAYDRSDGAIDFPSAYAECYAYMQGHIYGPPGHFYDQKDVRPWMPEGLVVPYNVQVNYIAARGPHSLCVALMNESSHPLDKVTVHLDLSRFESGAEGTHPVRVWHDNKPDPEPVQMINGTLQVSLSAKGITALVIGGITPKVAFQNDLAASNPSAPAETFRRFQTPFGDAEAMVLSFGPKLTWLYVYLTADRGTLRTAKLTAAIDGRTETLDAGTFPWEFSLPLKATDKKIRLSVEAVTASGESKKSDVISLSTPN